MIGRFRSVPVMIGLALSLIALTARAQDKVTFGTNWYPQPEHGGFYQALADGTYARHGLDVTIVPGGPQKNNRVLLSAGRIDFLMGGNLIQPFMAVANDVPTMVVAAIFQKEPQALFAHADAPWRTLGDLRGANTVFLSKTGQATFWRWLVAAHGFRDEQVKPYTFNLQPFLADRGSVVQGYVTSEALAIQRQTGTAPKVFLLADEGFDSYSTTIETLRSTIEAKPDVVRRFVDASVIGWYNYLYGDSTAANLLIKRDNPEMDDARIADAVAAMRRFGIVDSGDAEKLGIGAMTAERIESFYRRMVEAGVVPGGLDLSRAYTLRFVNRGVGLSLRRASQEREPAPGENAGRVIFP